MNGWFARVVGPLSIALAIVAAAMPGSALAWECRRCPSRDLAIFGIAVPDPLGDATLGYADWLSMHLVSGGVLDALFNEDPSRECLNVVEAQMAAQGGSAAGQFQHGMGDFPAPTGSVGGTDYMLTGSIGIPQLGRDYVLTLNLETAESRDTVATVSAPYDIALSGGANGHRLARQLMPLMETIRDFERRKRDQVPAVAIDVDDGVTIEPAHRVIKTHERVTVRYRLTDCDDTPLERRIIAPFATLGRLMVDQVPQTDANGQLELDFTAGANTGEVKLRAEFQYVQPFGREDTGGGDATLTIVDHSLWARVSVANERHRNLDEDDGRKVEKSSSNGSDALAVYMYFEPKPFRVYYADASLTPVRFKHRLAGFMHDRFVHHAAGSSYDGVRGYPGMDREITASYTEMAQLDGIELVQQDDDYVTYELDPDTGSITRVDLPRMQANYTVYFNRTCEKVDHYRGTREDCSSKWKETRRTSTQAPAEEACDAIALIGPTMVSGRCRVPIAGKYDRRQIDYEWEFHRE